MRWAAACALALFCTSAASADQAVVRRPGATNIETGQALIAHHQGLCLAILPTHVLAEAKPASLRAAGVNGTLLGELVSSVDLADDLSLGIVSGALARDCGHGLGTWSRNVNARLANTTQGSLRFVNGDGTLGFQAVAWIDNDGDLLVRVESLSGSLQKGMSGSALLDADGVPVGILLSVHARSGIGTVMRIDRALERVERALARLTSENSEAAQTASGQPPAGGTGAMVGLLGWSAEPADHHSRALNLLMDWSVDAAPWMTVPVRGNVELEFGFQAPTVIEGISLDVSGVAASRLPSAIEVLASASTDFARLRSVWSGALPEPTEGQVNLRFAPTRMAAVRLVLYRKDSSSGEQAFSLRRIAFQPSPPQ